LPDQAMTAFDAQVQAALAELEPAAAKNTEVQRLVRQRVGQQAFRHAMLDYWGGACAVTGVAVPQALRASHAKAWALCATDAERLDVYNGFLLSANLDALFDANLATFLPGRTGRFARRTPQCAASARFGAQPAASVVR
jgi:putative restriction endonuclease